MFYGPNIHGPVSKEANDTDQRVEEQSNIWYLNFFFLFSLQISTVTRTSFQGLQSAGPKLGLFDLFLKINLFFLLYVGIRI